jgi:tetratricopeptide (TPR) repeat protein
VKTFCRAIAVTVAVTLLAGCAARGPRAAAPQPAATPTADPAAPATYASLSVFMQKDRQLSVSQRPEKKDAPETLEMRDAALAADLQRVAVSPSADLYRTIGERYQDHGILDSAYRNFNRAVAMNPRDAAAYEGLARVWRDWGLPELALGDAQRATFYAPRSASARNTYGTVMQALGRYQDATAAYELAARLEPHAAYAVNNLCYLSFVNARIDDAIDKCSAALRIDSSLTAARNNLALAFAASGRMDAARAQFLDAGDRASGLYNAGIAFLASGDEVSALAAFDEASRARPTFAISRERADAIRAKLGFRAAAERLEHASR